VEKKEKEPKKKEWGGLMETDDAVEKQRTVFPQHLAKRCCVSHRFHRPGGDQSTNEQNNKTGHFTCYKNRTFSFATDSTAERRKSVATAEGGCCSTAPRRGARKLDKME
jgi:hypothetical protein